MDEQTSLITITISLVTSIVGSIVVLYYLRFRENQIRKKILEIESEESFLEKISKGNIKLLRSTFVVILLAMSLGFTSMAIVISANALEFEGSIKNYSYGFSAWLLFMAASVCFLQFRSIIRLSDLKKTKKNLQEKREKLESKLR